MAWANAKSGIRWRDKVDMKEPGMDLGQGGGIAGRAINSQDHFIPARRRWTARAKGRGDEAIGSAYIACGKTEADRVGRTASEHAGAVQSISTDASESSGTRKRVHHQEIGVLCPAVVPKSELGIIAQEGRVGGVHLQCIEE